jgi:hypothetical protein
MAYDTFSIWQKFYSMGIYYEFDASNKRGVLGCSFNIHNCYVLVGYEGYQESLNDVNYYLLLGLSTA